MASIRLYVEHPLSPAQRVPLSRDQAHYLFGVMRLSLGEDVLVFNGADGEWRTQVAEAGKKGGVLTCVTQTQPQENPPDLWLLIAPIRKERMAFAVEKAVELGVSRIVPVQTDFTQDAKRLRIDKLQATAVEAAEQCEATYVPTLAPLQKLAPLLSAWDPARTIMFCDESKRTGTGLPAHLGDGRAAILIGPEGGFSPAERDQLHSHSQATPVSLGPRILRAETAAVVALTLWQSQFGDWE